MDGAYKIVKTARRTDQTKRTGSQSSEDIFDRELRRHRDACVMASESVQPVRIGSGNQRFAKTRRHFFRAAV